MAEYPQILDTEHIDGDAYEWPPKLVGGLIKKALKKINDVAQETKLDPKQETAE